MQRAEEGEQSAGARRGEGTLDRGLSGQQGPAGERRKELGGIHGVQQGDTLTFSKC